jgi:hypothetical protein
MDLSHFFHWLANSWVANAINESEWLFPVIESIHITGLAVLIGTIAIVDLRLLGLVLPKRPVTQLAAELRPFTLTGIFIMLTTGPLMLSAAPERGYGNPAFSFKMSFLLAALVTHFTIHRRATLSDRVSGATLGEKLTACISLILWTGVVAGGRAIAFF